MIYTVINGEISIKKIKITSMASASSFFVGDVNRVALSSWLAVPPEETIVGVTVGVVSSKEESDGEGAVSGE